MSDNNRSGWFDWQVDTNDEAAQECDGTSRHTRGKQQAHDSGRQGGNRQSGWFHSRKGGADDEED